MPINIEFFTPVPSKRSVKIKAKKGIIYNNLNFTKRTLFYASNFIFIGCLLYLLYLYQPLAKAVLSYQIRKSETTNITVPNVIVPTPTPSNEFDLIIPKIGAVAKIVENVSPFNKEEYSKVLLENNVALAKGSYLPGSGLGKSTFIFAHSTEQGVNLVRNNSIFYLLDDLKNGDTVFVSMKGKVYEYRIYDRKIVNAVDIKYLTYEDPTREVIILQTCWPLGTNWKRLLVFGELI